MSNAVLNTLQEKNIFLITVPVNLTCLFQSLDVNGGPNGYVKRALKNKFCEWYSDQITQLLDEEQDIDAIDIPLKLSIIKSLYAKWMIEIYNHTTDAAMR